METAVEVLLGTAKSAAAALKFRHQINEQWDKYGEEADRIGEEYHAATRAGKSDRELEEAWRERQKAMTDLISRDSSLRLQYLKEFRLAVADDPLALWICDHAIEDGYLSEGLVVVSEFPITQSRLRRFRTEQYWCEIYDTYLENAMRAGVVPRD